jgi:hypothetical protein
MLVAMFVALAVVVVIGGIFGYRAVQARRPKEEPRLHFKCPHCRRRLGYRASQAGHKAMCTHCFQHLRFPEATEPQATNRGVHAPKTNKKLS